MGMVDGGAHRRHGWRLSLVTGPENFVIRLDTGTPMVFNGHMTTTRNTDDAPSFDVAAAIADNTAAQTVPCPIDGIMAPHPHTRAEWHAWERETGR